MAVVSLTSVCVFTFFFLCFLFFSHTGHFIGKVDPGTPAEAAGLKVSDRIIEVNGINVTQEAHKQVRRRRFLGLFFIGTASLM